jgi:hypothetical protein
MKEELNEDREILNNNIPNKTWRSEWIKLKTEYQEQNTKERNWSKQ